MRKAMAGAGAALIIGLSACGGTGGETANKAQGPGPDGIQNQLASMPEAQRNGVFIRAIRDARQECQHVESSRPGGEHQGLPVWNATCSGGGTFTIVIMNNGTATVLNAQEARLAGGNEAAPSNAQEQ
jgi:hypothetical protein